MGINIRLYGIFYSCWTSRDVKSLVWVSHMLYLQMIYGSNYMWLMIHHCVQQATRLHAYGKTLFLSPPTPRSTVHSVNLLLILYSASHMI